MREGGAVTDIEFTEEQMFWLAAALWIARDKLCKDGLFYAAKTMDRLVDHVDRRVEG